MATPKNRQALNVRKTTSAKKRASPRTTSTSEQPATTPQQLQAAAEAALLMVKMFVDFLPIKGEARRTAGIENIDGCFQSAGESYTAFERIRNPRQFPWLGRPGSFHIASPSPRSLPYFQELCAAMARVCDVFAWQGISDGSRIPHSMQRHGTALIPPIDAAVLLAVAVAGQGLLENLNPADIDGRQLVAKLTPKPHDNTKRTPARPSHSPRMDRESLIELLKMNEIKSTSPRSLSRFKTSWKAEPVPKTHFQEFHFRLAILCEMNVKYPSGWDVPLD